MLHWQALGNDEWTTGVHQEVRWNVALVALLLQAWRLEAQTMTVDRSLPGAPCEMVQSADDLYVGKVVGLTAPIHSNLSQPFTTSIHLKVLERFKNIGHTSRGLETLTSNNLGRISVDQHYLIHVRSPGPDDSFIYADQGQS